MTSLKASIMNNSKKGIKNILSNILSQLVSILLGIVVPRLMLVNLGSEANGLMTTVNNLLTYVALLEAGVGAAATQALYAPLARDDRGKTSEIVAAVGHFYRRTGRWYFVIVLLLTFVFPLTLQSTLPTWQIMAVMFLSGMPGVIKYYYQGKYIILLQAEGHGYILTNLTLIMNIATNFSKIALLVLGCDLVVLQLVYLMFNAAQVVFLLLYVRKQYPWLRRDAAPDYGAISQSKNALVHQVTGLIFSNTDTILLTYLCGLKTVSVYAMYAMLFNIISTAITNFSGANFILGQAFNTDRQRSLKLIDLYELFNMVLTFSLYCIAGLFIEPFLRLYTAGVTDINYLDDSLPYLMIATYLLSNGRASSSQIIEYAGHFKQTQWRAILEAAINVSVSLICVFRFGIYGVLFGTIAALLYRTNDIILYANRIILGRSAWKTYRRWLLNLALFIGVTAGGRLLLRQVDLSSYFRLIAWAALSCVVILPLFFGVLALTERETCRYAKDLILPRLRRLRRHGD